MSDTVIRVENLGKKYIIGHQKQERYTALRDVVTDRVKSSFASVFNSKAHKNDPTHEEFWALKDVSFDIKQGDRVGIIGRNGAGKSTLLKILSRITEPTSGKISIKGRVASLLEVGTGFHPELTGRENIFLNGAILGMDRFEIKKKFDEIVAFAEVEKFLDTPVKRYSSGMYVRLAFAVAAHLEPEVLVVDEVLAVGDAQFQEKCLGKMEEVAEHEGRTILFVSHNMTAMQTLCNSVIYLKKGRVLGIGPVEEQIKSYLKSFRHQRVITPEVPLKLTSDLSLNTFKVVPNQVISGHGITFTFQFSSSKKVRFDELAVLIYSFSGVRVAVLDLRNSDIFHQLDSLTNDMITIQIPNLPLVDGEYTAALWFSANHETREVLDIGNLTVMPQTQFGKTNLYQNTYRGFVDLEFSTIKAGLS